MKLPVLSTSIAALLTAAGAAAQTTTTTPASGQDSTPSDLSSPPASLSAPPSGLSAPPPGLSAPPGSLSAQPSGLSDPGLPGIFTPPVPGISTAIPPTLSASPLGSPTLATTPARSPFDDGPIFVGRQLGGLLTGASSSPSVSGGLLDALLLPMDPFALDGLPPQPGVSAASGATFSGGGAAFDEFCRPQDFTCR